MPTRLLIAALALSIPLVLPGSSIAARDASLAGSCSATGTARLDPAGQLAPVPDARFSFLGVGTCDGELGGRPIENAPIRLVFKNARTTFDSCLAGMMDDAPGLLIFKLRRGRSIRIPVLLGERRLLTMGPITVRGRDGGAAAGTLTVRAEDPVVLLGDCAAGRLETAEFDTDFATSSPLVGKRVARRRGR